MNDAHDLELILRSGTPLILVETHEEGRVRDLFRGIVLRINKPLFCWTVTDGLQRIDLDLPAQQHNRDAEAVLRQIRETQVGGIYLLLDFHPYLQDPVNQRLLKEICQQEGRHHVVLVSPRLKLPEDLRRRAARLQLTLPDAGRLRQIIRETANIWSIQNERRKVRTDSRTLDRLVQNLSGLSETDARRLARQVIFDDGAITESDLPEVMQAKYELLGRDGVLSFEYETERFAEVGGMRHLKSWLELRRQALAQPATGLDPPRGILLLGVQGCGKSLAARAVAGIFGVPLLHLDFGAIYNKYHGESERNLRQALRTAELMSPCVLWMDEIEKGLSTGDADGGTSRRILGTLLTWMAEHRQPVFLVATANNIEDLPPELVRKGRFDEIFFVDLPAEDVRAEILRIHTAKRGHALPADACQALARLSEGFSGAELEQAVVSARYAAHAREESLDARHIESALRATRPLSVLMAERIQALRDWARDRTVPVD